MPVNPDRRGPQGPREDVDPAELRKLHAAGLSIDKIAAAVKRTPRTVQRMLAKLRREEERERPTADLRSRILARLERAAEGGSVPADKVLLDAIDREESLATYADAQHAIARAWARETSAELGAWCREHSNPKVRELYRKCTGTLVADTDREALIELVLELGWSPDA